jgi:hypothetical protein
MKLVKSSLIAAATIAGSLMVALPASAAVFYHDDFDGNNPAFTTDYTIVAPSAHAGEPEGVEIITNNPNSVHPSWAAFTNGTGNALLVNGSTGAIPNDVFTSALVPVVASGSYSFSASVANICCNTSFLNNSSAESKLLFAFIINGVEQPTALTFTTQPGPVGNAYPDAGTFFTVTSAVNLLAGDTFQLIIRNDINVAGGNDFALDNILLENTPTTNVPEPLTLSLFGAGLAGAAALRRRKKAA